jgi:agmatine deiminase
MKRRHTNDRTQKHLSIENLEARKLMAADLGYNGTWAIQGTSQADEIYVTRDAQDSRVLLVEINGTIVGEQNAAEVRRITISGKGGNDHIEIDQTFGSIKVPTVIRGDQGNDVLVGGSGNDLIYGGTGNDELLGEAGDDRLYGEDGDDYLEGGQGTDYLNGGRGNNELVQDSPGNTTPPAAKVVKLRVPAEWEKHDSTWMQWPKGEEASYRENFAGIIRTLQAYEQVNLAVESSQAKVEAEQFLAARGVPLGNIAFHIMPYDWSWMRDNGAIWVEGTNANGDKSLAVQDWGFDGWGGDGGPSRKDDAVPIHVARIESASYKQVDVVLEKGTLEFNGKDTVIASWTVLHDRNPQMTQAQLESALKDNFGVSKIVWLVGASQGDLTDGHVDGIARFVNETTVAVGRYTDQSDADAALFERAAATIKAAGFNVVRLDIPGYVQYRGEWLPANYTNYLVANGVVIASSYGNARFDNAAKAQLQQLFPTRDIVMTDTRELWYNGGAVHCVTNDQPLLRQGTTARALTAQSLVSQFSPIANSRSTAAVSVSASETAFNRVVVKGDEIISPTDTMTGISVLNQRYLTARSVDSVFAEFQRRDISQDGLLTSPDAFVVVNPLNKPQKAR